MDLQKLNSYMNHELMHKPDLAWEIALNQLLFDDQEDFKKNYMFMEATNAKHPKNPNSLLFKHKITREYTRIPYELLDCI